MAAYHCKHCRKVILHLQGTRIISGAVDFECPRRWTFDCQYCEHEQALLRADLQPAPEPCAVTVTRIRVRPLPVNA